MTIETLIEQIGLKFVGLWIYQPYGKTRKWCVTFRDLHNEYWETDLFDMPIEALKQAASVLEQQANGQSVMATGSHQTLD
jgi:hypothetical protein